MTVWRQKVLCMCVCEVIPETKSITQNIKVQQGDESILKKFPAFIEIHNLLKYSEILVRLRTCKNEI